MTHQGVGGEMHTRIKTAVISGLLAILLLVIVTERASGFFEIPAALPQDEFGNILINRTSELNDVQP
jgi:hypothetical protein